MTERWIKDFTSSAIPSGSFTSDSRYWGLQLQSALHDIRMELGDVAPPHQDIVQARQSLDQSSQSDQSRRIDPSKRSKIFNPDNFWLPTYLHVAQDSPQSDIEYHQKARSNSKNHAALLHLRSPTCPYSVSATSQGTKITFPFSSFLVRFTCLNTTGEERIQNTQKKIRRLWEGICIGSLQTKDLRNAIRRYFYNSLSLLLKARKLLLVNVGKKIQLMRGEKKKIEEH